MCIVMRILGFDKLLRRAAESLPLASLAPPFPVRTGWAVEYADAWGNVIGLTDDTRAPALARTEEEP